MNSPLPDQMEQLYGKGDSVLAEGKGMAVKNKIYVNRWDENEDYTQ